MKNNQYLIYLLHLPQSFKIKDANCEFCGKNCITRANTYKLVYFLRTAPRIALSNTVLCSDSVSTMHSIVISVTSDRTFSLEVFVPLEQVHKDIEKENHNDIAKCYWHVLHYSSEHSHMVWFLFDKDYVCLQDV